MSLEPDNTSEAIFTHRDGRRTYAIEKVSLLGCFPILMALALGVSLVPANWFQ